MSHESPKTWDDNEIIYSHRIGKATGLVKNPLERRGLS